MSGERALVVGRTVLTEALEDRVRRVVREELRRCGLKPPRPPAEMVEGTLRTWVWDEAADAWVPGAR